MELIQRIDVTIILWLQTLHNTFFDGFFAVITTLGDNGAIWLAAAAVMLFSRKYRKFGILLIISLAAGYLLGDILLKNLVARPRPFQALPEISLLIHAPHGFSFPSGHSLAAFAASVILLYANRKFGIPAFCLAGLIVFSRAYLAVHYPTDVLAGALIGALVALAVVRITRKRGWLPPRKVLPTETPEKNGQNR